MILISYMALATVFALAWSSPWLLPWRPAPMTRTHLRQLHVVLVFAELLLQAGPLLLARVRAVLDNSADNLFSQSWR